MDVRKKSAGYCPGEGRTDIGTDKAKLKKLGCRPYSRIGSELLLRMGVWEFLYFETIPTKVTINEYIDLAKAYSTVQKRPVCKWFAG
jgi:hypothetical protein